MVRPERTPKRPITSNIFNRILLRSPLVFKIWFVLVLLLLGWIVWTLREKQLQLFCEQQHHLIGLHHIFLTDKDFSAKAHAMGGLEEERKISIKENAFPTLSNIEQLFYKPLSNPASSSSQKIDSSKMFSCAMVGNSGILTEFGEGADIERHDIVIRFNKPQLEGFEAHTGNRTDMSFQNVGDVYWTKIFRIPQYRDVLFLFKEKLLSAFPYKYFAQPYSEFLRRHRSYQPPQPRPRLQQRKEELGLKRTSLFVREQFQEIVRDLVGIPSEFKPSTGITAFVIATQLCKWPIDMYGFGALRGSAAPHHYYNDTNKHPTEFHDWDAEWRYMTAGKAARCGMAALHPDASRLRHSHDDARITSTTKWLRWLQGLKEQYLEP